MFYAKTVELESGDQTESGKLKNVLPGLRIALRKNGRISTIQNVNDIQLYRNNTTKTKLSNCNYRLQYF